MATDPVFEAITAQRAGGYVADVWFNFQLEAMTKVWQGIGGKSNFFFSEQDAREARGAFENTVPYRFAETLWRMAQVQPNLKLGFRIGIREYVVDIRTRAAVGICRSNPALGSGSVFQYYIPDWEQSLMPTGREHRFPASGYPKL